MEDEIPLLQLVCGLCQEMFYVCVSDFRGQTYCPGCRAAGRARARRAANARHQQSDEGRLDHRDQNRAWRRRCAERDRTRVTDTGIRKVACGSKWLAPPGPTPSISDGLATGSESDDHERIHGDPVPVGGAESRSVDGGGGRIVAEQRDHLAAELVSFGRLDERFEVGAFAGGEHGDTCGLGVGHAAI